MHFFPHLLGEGLLHDLVLFRCPSSQLALHWLQPDQAENIPSTATIMETLTQHRNKGAPYSNYRELVKDREQQKQKTKK